MDSRKVHIHEDTNDIKAYRREAARFKRGKKYRQKLEQLIGPKVYQTDVRFMVLTRSVFNQLTITDVEDFVDIDEIEPSFTHFLIVEDEDTAIQNAINIAELLQLMKEDANNGN